jgi:hypothetical protein
MSYASGRESPIMEVKEEERKWVLRMIVMVDVCDLKFNTPRMNPNCKCK